MYAPTAETTSRPDSFSAQIARKANEAEARHLGCVRQLPCPSDGRPDRPRETQAHEQEHELNTRTFQHLAVEASTRERLIHCTIRHSTYCFTSPIKLFGATGSVSPVDR